MNKDYLFFKSAVNDIDPLNDSSIVLKWIRDQNNKVKVSVEKILFDELINWSFCKKNHNLKHNTGRFFSIDGINVKTNSGLNHNWDQPIINQPEIGFLGFITKEFKGVLHFLIQAKIEPGNINYVQLSPTLQATKSNYSQVHKGKEPAFINYFKNAKPNQILLDQLQSEQGSRFLKKRNRNIIIKIDEEIPINDNFKWLTLAQIKELMSVDNLVNMDTRTVISGITFDNLNKTKLHTLDKSYSSAMASKIIQSIFSKRQSLHTFDEIISFITRTKVKYEINITRIPLNNLTDWNIDIDSISHVDKKYFQVIAAKITIGNREVTTWTQPMIEPLQEGLCAFVCKEINGVLHFAVQAKLECGNFDIIEFAPTVQCLTGNYKDTPKNSLPFLDYILNIPDSQIIIDTYQSEEGGRFYREQNRNMIVFAGDELGTELPQNYIWMTLYQLQEFIKFNNYINIQARSLIAALKLK